MKRKAGVAGLSLHYSQLDNTSNKIAEKFVKKLTNFWWAAIMRPRRVGPSKS